MIEQFDSPGGSLDPALEYADLIAPEYDTRYSSTDDVPDLVAFCRSLVEVGSSVLEFGVGTGRVAVPLSNAGFRVTGVDQSERMLAELRRKPGSEAIDIKVANMRSIRLGRRYDLLLCVFNTLYALPDQEAQVEFLANASTHLVDGGYFVLETTLTHEVDFSHNKRITPLNVANDSVEMALTMHDPVAQMLRRQTFAISPNGFEVRMNVMRYVSAAELDLMARIAGLRVVARYGNWNRAAFDGGYGCISVLAAG